MSCRGFPLTVAWVFILAMLLHLGSGPVWAGEEGSKIKPGSSEAVEGRAPKESAGATDTKFGLTLKQRKRIFMQSLDAEKRAQREATERYPDHPGSVEYVQLADQLSAEYGGQVARTHGLTPEQLVEVEAEGYSKEWPVLQPQPVSEQARP